MSLPVFAIRSIPCIALAFVLSTAHAADGGSITDLQTRALNEQIWHSPEWLNLLHYRGDSETAADYRSEVNDKRFFLAQDGNVNPETELHATIAAFYRTDLFGDEHAQCRFVARLNWLKQKLSIEASTLPAVQCNSYIEWRKHVNSDLVTLVFPAYNLNSPSSMYGHTLLRLDSTKDEGNARWLSTAVNFGAVVTEDDNSILYAWKGIAGGYSGVFITDHYYKKIQEYNLIEHRDIWEYRLNLTADETERIVTHLWELQDIHFDYYYFDENCSYRLLELLEIARPGTELTDEFKITAIPVDTVRAIEHAGMIEEKSYRPSRATVLRHLLKQVPEQDHELILDLSEDITVAKQDKFLALPEDRQRIIVDIAYQYLRYQQTGKARDPAVAKRSHQLLLLLNSYPKDTVSDTKIDTPVSPDKGHGSKRTSIGLGKRLGNNYLDLGFKMSFHDLEDNEDGFLRGAQINIGALQIRAEENESISLFKLDIIDIVSLTPRTAFFKPLAWKGYAGLQTEYTNGIDQLTAAVSGGGGGSWSLFKNNQVYLLATARLEINEQMDRFIEPAIGFTSGVLQHFGSSTAHLDFSGDQFSNSMYRLRLSYIQNFVISTNHSIKLSAKFEWQEVEDFSDVQLNYQYYF